MFLVREERKNKAEILKKKNYYEFSKNCRISEITESRISETSVRISKQSLQIKSPRYTISKLQTQRQRQNLEGNQRKWHITSSRTLTKSILDFLSEYFEWA